LRLYPQHFDFFSHLQENRTPLLALAFPRVAFNMLGIAFDETLTTGEDWDYLMRTAAVCGVEATAEITAIYRHWNGRNASRTDHSSAEWEKNLGRIQEKQNMMPMLIAEGSAQYLRRILDERDLLARAVRQLSRTDKNSRQNEDFRAAVDLANRTLVTSSPERLTELRVALTALYDSAWWRLSAPVRWASAVTGRRRFRQPDPHDLTEAHLSMAIESVMNSTSWKLTHPIRSLLSRLERRS
jgi:hypothetical protein